MSAKKHTPSNAPPDADDTLEDLERILEASRQNRRRFARLVTELCQKVPSPEWVHDDTDRAPTDREMQQLLALSRAIGEDLRNVDDADDRKRRLEVLLQRIRDGSG